jgi:hypothetical protein
MIKQRLTYLLRMVKATAHVCNCFRIFACIYNLPEPSPCTAVISVTMNTRPDACKYLGNDILLGWEMIGI